VQEALRWGESNQGSGEAGIGIEAISVAAGAGRAVEARII
jgi:hypothetical protein